MTQETMKISESNTFSEKFALQSSFKTLGDTLLEKMFTEACRYVFSVSERHCVSPRWLTVCGRSGTGKTMLMTELFNFCERNFRSSSKMDGDRASLISFVSVSSLKLANDFREGFRCGYASEADFLFVDDVGAESDSTGFVTGRICDLLSERVGKWTLLTSNLTLTELGDAYDSRISSRIVRGDNVFVPLYWKDKGSKDIKFVKDFSFRPKKERS